MSAASRCRAEVFSSDEVTSVNKILPLIIGLAACIFVFVGASWFVAPSFAASVFDMALLEGRALASQTADLGSFFITLGICMLLGVLTKNVTWYYPAMMLLALATCGRVISRIAHEAALTLDMIAVEVVVVSLLAFASRQDKDRAAAP